MSEDRAEFYLSLKQAAIKSLKAAIERIRERREIDDLGRDELERLARDAGLSLMEFRANAGTNSDWVRLLEKRIAQFDLDKSIIEKTYPRVVRDLEQTCARCESATRCENDLTRSDGKDAVSSYCPNTHTLGALKTERDGETLQSRV